MNAMEKPAKLLVVDDSADSHEMVELLFNVPGETGPRPLVFHAAEGREGLDILARHQDMDVILLDLRMPVMDGFEVMTRLAADRRFQSIPVCVFSANKDDATKALKLGARDFVNKPADYLELKLRLLNLVAAKRRADAAERMKIDFLSVVSHELRTPMNGVIGMAQAIKDGGLTPEQDEYLAALQGSSARMLTLVNNVIGFLESENPLHSLPRVPFSLRQVIQGALERHGDEARRNGVVCSFALGRGVPDQLVGLPDKLSSILEHLVSNAVKFSPGGQATVEVSREPEPDTVLLTFEVQDSGVGYPQEWVGRPFEPFRQKDGSETRKFGGLGIGLAVAARLVEMLGGVLDVESSAPGGSRFRFTLAFTAE